jgi:hypothetical protein
MTTGNRYRLNKTIANGSSALNRPFCIVKKAQGYLASHQDKETPLTLLEAALRKLNHEEMQVTAIAVAQFGKARQFASDIQKRAREIEGEIYHAQKDHDSLATKR